MGDIKVAQWQQWDIALADFADTNLGSVKKLYIGFGDRDNPLPGGSGVVHFDDIRLYGPICVEPQPRADLSGDCVVDGKDLKIMAEEWLDSGEVAADLHVDAVVDFKDYAVFAEGWLEDGRWPAQ
jgi:hypothetical protein